MSFFLLSNIQRTQIGDMREFNLNIYSAGLLSQSTYCNVADLSGQHLWFCVCLRDNVHHYTLLELKNPIKSIEQRKISKTLSLSSGVTCDPCEVLRPRIWINPTHPLQCSPCSSAQRIFVFSCLGLDSHKVLSMLGGVSRLGFPQYLTFVMCFAFRDQLK